MKQDLNKVDKYPYSRNEYIRRLLWNIAKVTIWKLLWHRFPALRMSVLKIFGTDTHFSSMAFGSTNVFRPWDLKIGKKVALGPRVHLYNLSRMEIGDHTVISQDAYLCGGTHDHTKDSLPLLRKDIVIGESVWICAGAFIGPGIVIGDGAVIGARAVVVKDVAPWTIVAGNPAKILGKRKITNN